MYTLTITNKLFNVVTNTITGFKSVAEAHEFFNLYYDDVYSCVVTRSAE